VELIERENQKRVRKNRASYSFARERGFLYLRVGIAAILVVFILQWIDFEFAARTIAEADLRYVVLILALAFLDRYLMAYKWNILLRLKGMAFTNAEAFRIYLASVFAGTFLPTGVGADVFRAFRATTSGRSADEVTASIVVERVIGLFAVTVIALIGLGALVRLGEVGFRELYYLTCVFLLVIMICLSLSILTPTFHVVKRLLSPFEKYKLVRMYIDFHGAYIEFSRHWKTMLFFFLLTVLEQGVLIMMNFWCAQALGFSITLVYFVAIVPLSSLVVKLPISIGGIGVVEGSYILLFALAGLSATESVSLSFVMRVIGWAVLVPCGLVFLYDSASFKRLGDSVKT